MEPRDKEKYKDQHKERQEQQQQLAKDYKMVFGSDEKRSKAQQAVWEDLRRIGFQGAPITLNTIDAHGRVDQLKLAENAGLQRFFIHLKSMIHFADNPPQNETTVVKE